VSHPGRVEGKVAIVTGGAKGLGEADCRLLAAHGAKVVIADVDTAPGEALAEELGDSAVFMHLDVTQEDSWQSVIGETVTRFGGLHVLVNNAGIVEVGNVVSCTADEWRRVNAVSADGTFFGCKYAIPHMVESGGGSIINMGSIASLQGEAYVAAYCAAKGAVEALTRAVAVHCAQSRNGVRCNSIHPSGIATPMVASMPEKMAGADFKPYATAGAGGSKIGEPDDIAYMVLYLASDESKFVSGSAMRVDNTMSVTCGLVAG
jgi:3(or 17)beta-hydroxysteroid dehydrogenase